MHHNYDDIISRVVEPPTWFDENAVPRFCDFSPSVISDIYADEAVLAEIACQNCETKFFVAFSLSRNMNQGPSLAKQIENRSLHYGDPPNIDCCAGGPSMNSEMIRVVQYWSRHHEEYVENGIVTHAAAYMTWTRRHDLEVNFAVPDIL